MEIPRKHLDEDRLHELLGHMVTEMGAAATGPLVMIGEALGLYDALATIGPATTEELASRTGTHPRYVREWLAAQAASGYVTYESASSGDGARADGPDRFFLTPEQTAVFADRDSPTYMAAGFEFLRALYDSVPDLKDAFQSGDGVSWGDHCGCLFSGTEKFFRPTYRAHLVQEWLPALPGVVPKLKKGARVADVGCGYGASTRIMAEAFPQSTFVGIDLHEGSIRHAQETLAANGSPDNLRFEVAAAEAIEGPFDFITFFDCLHDMGDPVAALQQAREQLRPNGSVLLVEPMAGNDLADNLNPVGRTFYAASTQVCVPSAMSQDGRRALGAQAGEARLREVARDAGFGSVKRVAETPFNMVLDVRGME